MTFHSLNQDNDFGSYCQDLRNEIQQVKPILQHCYVLCIQEADTKRQVDMEFFIMIGNYVKGLAKVISAEVAIPANRGIRIRKMPWTFAFRDSMLRRVTYLGTISAGMCMDAGAIPWYSEVFRRNQTEFKR